MKKIIDSAEKYIKEKPERAALWFFSVGIISSLIYIIIFIFSGFINPTQSLNPEIAGEFGDFIGGFTGTAIAGVSVILLFAAYNKQKEQLDVMKGELRNTKEELEATRKIAKEQSETSRQQKFENMFFKMIDNYIRWFREKNSSEINSFSNQIKSNLLEYSGSFSNSTIDKIFLFDYNVMKDKNCLKPPSIEFFNKIELIKDFIKKQGGDNYYHYYFTRELTEEERYLYAYMHLIKNEEADFYDPVDNNYLGGHSSIKETIKNQLPKIFIAFWNHKYAFEIDLQSFLKGTYWLRIQNKNPEEISILNFRIHQENICDVNLVFKDGKAEPETIKPGQIINYKIAQYFYEKHWKNLLKEGSTIQDVILYATENNYANIWDEANCEIEISYSGKKYTYQFMLGVQLPAFSYSINPIVHLRISDFKYN